jgi:hypothetical protein
MAREATRESGIPRRGFPRRYPQQDYQHGIVIEIHWTFHGNYFSPSKGKELADGHGFIKKWKDDIRVTCCIHDRYENEEND